MYPVMLNLTGKRICVIGGGNIALRKVRGLLNEGAAITVIAPLIHHELLEYDIEAIPEAFHHDLSSYDMIFIATDDDNVNEQVIRQLMPHQLVNDCTNKRRSNFFNVAHFKQDHYRVMISTDGDNPQLSKEIKDKIKNALNHKWT